MKNQFLAVKQRISRGLKKQTRKKERKRKKVQAIFRSSLPCLEQKNICQITLRGEWGEWWR